MEARLSFYVALLITVLQAHAQDDAWLLSPPEDLGRPHEEPTNMTLEEAIALSMTNAPSTLLNRDGLVLTDGDVLLTKDMYERVYGKQKSDETSKRNAVKEDLRWPDAEMPYSVVDYDFNDYEKYMLIRAMNEWERYTCFRFRPKNRTTRYWTRIQNGYMGCNAALGFIKRSPQDINLNKMGCRVKSTYMHEMGHAMGLIHEHQRPDRDDWVSIIFSNINPTMIDVNFKKYPTSEVDMMGVPYDYSSIMHYISTAFSYDNKHETIVPRYPERATWMDETLNRILSYRDVEIVNKMYKCAAHCPNKDKCGKNGHLNENCNCICEDGSTDCDTTNKAKDTNCRNVFDSWHCYIWANQGECERNSFYMKKACAKACGACGPKQPTPATCGNVYRNKKCDFWAERGDCVTNYSWMKRNCPKACKLCSAEDAKPAESCENKYKRANKCDQKARDGDCKIDPVGMYRNCKRSCRWCDKEMIGVIGKIRDDKWNEKISPCKDKSPYCGDWASNGHCESNPAYMYMDCPKSCGKCDDGTCKNLFSDAACEKKAKLAECRTNFLWMRDNCALTCRLGVCEGAEGVNITPKPTTTKRPTTQEPIDPNCFDKSGTKNCHSWNQGNANFCNRHIAATTCKKTCGYCGCKEAYDECASWAASGDCRTNVSFMMHNCQKSCKLC